MKPLTKNLFWFLTIFLPQSLSAQFISTWRTDADDTQLTIPAFDGPTYDYSVYWENVDDATDFGSLAGQTGSATMTGLTGNSTYRVEISGTFPRIYFNNSGDREKILTIEQWGDIAWTAMNSAFYGCTNLTVPAVDAPDLTGVISLQQMFRDATSFNDPIDHWEVDNITGFFGVFWGATSFNQPLDNWNMDAATNLSHMFNSATSFNQPLDSWNTTGVTEIRLMFNGATAFNQSINHFDVSLVSDFAGTFENASSFNRPLDNWEMGGATTLGLMFSGASSFNQPIDNWDVSNVASMNYMFQNATNFDGDLGPWNIESIGTMTGMLNGCGMSITNYDKTLIGWATLDAGEAQIPVGVPFRAIGLSYCNGASARTTLDETYTWEISSGDSQNCSETLFVTTWQTDNSGTSNNDQIRMPITGSGFDVDWVEVGNATNNGSLSNQTGPLTITFPSAGTYRVLVDATSLDMRFEGGGDAQKILTIEQWGSIQWTWMYNAYGGCTNLTIPATDAPDLTLVTDARNMFENCSSFNEPIDHWDVGSITNMERMFRSATSFNQDLNSWDVRGVTNMNFMFNGATSFNGNISSWETESLGSMQSMFWSASAFNQPIGDWDVSGVGSFYNVFQSATSFNQPLDDWEVSGANTFSQMFWFATSFNQDLNSWQMSGATAMVSMFRSATAFNGDISSWNVSGVTSTGFNFMFQDATSFNGDISGWTFGTANSFNSMFRNATSFNQDLSGWGVSGIQNMSYMFSGADLFNQDISGWETGAVTNFSNMFSFNDAFNGDVSAWDVSSATSVNGMFSNATSFDQDLGGWDISLVTNMSSLLSGTNLSVANYDATLQGWASLDAGETQIPTVITLGANGLTYCQGADARSELVNTYGWAITDDGLACPDFPSELFTTEVSSTQIDLSWTDNSSNETAFAIFRSDGNNSGYTEIGTVGANETTYSDNTVTANNNYFYYIVARNGIGDSSPSNEKAAATFSQPGNSLSFDGTNDYISVSDDAAFQFGMGDFTLELWFYYDGSDIRQTLISKRNSATPFDQYFMAIGDGFINSGSGRVLYAGVLPDNRTGSGAEETMDRIVRSPDDLTAGWHHAALVQNYTDGLSLFLNGQLISTDTDDHAGGVADANGFDLTLGASSGSLLFFSNEIDEVRIWNVARSEAEIQSNITSDLNGGESGLLAYYKFDQTDASISILPDRSTNSYDGTLTNFGGSASWTTSGAMELQAPEVYGATNITTSGFTASFSVPNGATDILIDVDDDADFSSPLATNVSAGLTESYNVTLSLTEGTTYYYRIRSDFGAEQSDYVASEGFRVAPGNGLSFDGVNDYVSIPDDPSLQVASTLTISAWVKRSRLDGTDIILEKGGDWNLGNPNYGLGLHPGNNYMFYFYYNGGWLGTSGVDDLNWHHYAVVAQNGSTDLELYIDGILQPIEYSGGSGTINFTTSSDPLIIGAQVTDLAYYGANTIDEVRIWNTLRSAGEIQADMFSTLTGSEDNLVAYYQFDEGIADGDNTSPAINVLPDLSAANDGTLINMALNGSTSNWVGSEALNNPFTGGVYTEEYDALVALYNATGGASWTNNTGWLSGNVTDWYGVTVSVNRVTEIRLDENNLIGTIPSEIGDLSELIHLDMELNQLAGAIPTTMGNLVNLDYVDLEENQLTGDIPSELGNLINATELDLMENQLSGAIPVELGNMSSLLVLELNENQLTGSIPGELGNLSSLVHLNLERNQLSGSIPAALGNLTNLDYLDLEENQLTGNIPTELGNLINLTELDLMENQLSGTIPVELGNMSSLGILELNENQLTGSIPSELGNLLALEYMSLERNQLTGSIPSTLGNLVNLTFLDLEENQLTGSIPAELGNLVLLTELDLMENQLSGSIPGELGSMSSLEILELNENQLTGSIPVELGGLTSLQYLNFEQNQLTGSIPSELGSLTNLVHLYLNDNELSGSVPSELSGLVSLEELLLSRNSLDGDFPDLGLTNLNWVTLAHNDFTGSVPAFFADNLNMIGIGLANNNFTGAIPETYGQLTSLDRLNIGGNQLTILPDLTGATSLTFFNAADNNFEFDDIEPNVGIGGIVYSPQADLPGPGDLVLNEGEDLDITIAVGGSNNVYQWYLDGSPVSGQTSDNLLISPVTLADAGTYHLEVTNTLATSLTLSSESFTVTVNPALEPEIEVFVGADNMGTPLTDGQLTEVDFGSSEQATDLSVTFAIENTGDADLNIGSITSSELEFTISGAPSTIGIGVTETFDIILTGATIGSFNADITINSDDSDEGAFTFPVTGEIVSQDLAVVANATDTEICEGEEITLTGSGADTYSWDNGVTDGVAFVPTATTTYTVTGTDGDGNMGTDQITITVHALPTVTATTTDSEICEGEEITLTGTGADTYAWDNGVTDGVSFAPTGTQTYTVTGTDANSCTNTDQVTITVNTLPTVTATTTANEICEGEEITLTGTGADTYAWDNGVTDGVSFTPTGTQTYTVTGTDANGCTNTDQITITVHALPTVTATTTDSEICEGEEITLTGTGADTYAWDHGVTDGVSFSPASTETYTVTGTDANGCTNTDQLTVTVSTLPTVIANATATEICLGEEVTLTGSGADTYTWDNEVTDGESFMPTQTTTYTVTGTGGVGCSNTDQIEIVVNPLPTVTASVSDAEICLGDEVVFTGGGAASYSWDNAVVDNVAFSPSGTATFTVTGTDENGCIATAQIDVTVNVVDQPTIEIVSDNGRQIVLSSSEASAYQWYESGEIMDGETGQTIQVERTYTFGGDYQVEITEGECSNISETEALRILSADDLSTKLEIWPNPVYSVLNVKLSQEAVGKEIKIYDLTGSVVDTRTLNHFKEFELDLSTLGSGVYFLAIEDLGEMIRFVKN